MPKKLLVGLNDLASQNTLLSEWCVATFILPEFVNYVFFNLRNLLYLIFYCLFCQIMPHNAKNKGFSALDDKTSCRSFCSAAGGLVFHGLLIGIPSMDAR